MPPTTDVTKARRVSQTSPAADEWLTPFRFSLVLGALIFAAFPQVLLGLETFVVRDYGFFAYPLAHFQRECFWRGELPLWDPYNNCGVPFLAQWNTMPLYPPALIYLLLPLTWSLSFFCLAHLFWAGLGMYFLAQRWTGNRLAASVAGVVFAFNGLSLNLLMWPSHIATLSWMPWVVLTVERGWKMGGRSLVLASLVGGLQMLAGGPETILFTWLISLTIWVVGIWGAYGKGRGGLRNDHVEGRQAAGIKQVAPEAEVAGSLVSVFWQFPLMVLLVFGLAAAQLLPFLDLAAHSQREQGYADARWSMPSWGWANFFVPMVFGNTWKQDLFFQYGQYWTSSYYIGIGAVLLAALAVWTVRGWRVQVLILASVAALVLAGGDQNFISEVVRRMIPQLSLITYPVKFVIVLTFAVPLLVAYALAQLRTSAVEVLAKTGTHQDPKEWSPKQGNGNAQRELERRIIFLAAMMLALISGILLWAWRWPFPLDDFPATLKNGLSRAGLLFLAVVVLLALGRATRPTWQKILPLALLLLCWLDVWTHEPPQNPTVPPWIYGPGMARSELAMQPQPAMGESRAMVSREAENKFMQLALNDPKNNYLAKRLGYFADCNLLDGVPKVNGFFSLYPRECGELNSALYVSTNICPPKLKDFMCVSQCTAKDEYVKWETRTGFLPFATAGQRPIFLDDTNSLAYLIGPDFDGRDLVFLPLELKGNLGLTNRSRARVTSQKVAAERIELEVEAEQTSLVVISQTYYHRWQAYVDDQQSRLLRANYAFQAVAVPAGKHRVILTYEDRPFYAGMTMSGITLAICVVGILKRVRGPKIKSSTDTTGRGLLARD